MYVLDFKQNEIRKSDRDICIVSNLYLYSALYICLIFSLCLSNSTQRSWYYFSISQMKEGHRYVRGFHQGHWQWLNRNSNPDLLKNPSPPSQFILSYSTFLCGLAFGSDIINFTVKSRVTGIQLKSTCVVKIPHLKNNWIILDCSTELKDN